jgi:hypothetical protein
VTSPAHRSPAELLEHVQARLRAYRFRSTSEHDVQLGIGAVLDFERVAFRREVVLSRSDRIDFLLEGGLGIEVKVDSSHTAVLRQLNRYASHVGVAALLLVTTRSKHIDMPSELQGKPVRVLFKPGFA